MRKLHWIKKNLMRSFHLNRLTDPCGANGVECFFCIEAAMWHACPPFKLSQYTCVVNMLFVFPMLLDNKKSVCSKLPATKGIYLKNFRLHRLSKVLLSESSLWFFSLILFCKKNAFHLIHLMKCAVLSMRHFR